MFKLSPLGQEMTCLKTVIAEKVQEGGKKGKLDCVTTKGRPEVNKRRKTMGYGGGRTKTGTRLPRAGRRSLPQLLGAGKCYQGGDR